MLIEAVQKKLHVSHAVQNRHDHGFRTDGGLDVIERSRELKSLKSDEDHIVALSDGIGGHDFLTEDCGTLGARDAPYGRAQLIRPFLPNDERDISPRLK